MTLLPFLFCGLLISVNALYVAAEFSAVAAQRGPIARWAREGNGRAQGLLSVLENGSELDRYIAACQIGITVASLVSGAVAQATIAIDLGPILMDAFHLDDRSARSAAALTVLVVLTACQVVLGELVPKAIALEFPEKTALFTYLPTRLSRSVYRGFIWFINGSGLLLLKPFGIEPGGHQHVHSPEEIDILLAESRRGGTLSPEEHRRLTRGLQLSSRTVWQLMVPRHEIVAIEASTPAPEILERVTESPYSRLPVYRGSLDEIVGALNAKDVVRVYAMRGELPPLEQLVRPIPFVPQSLTADRLVRFFQEQHTSKAMVVDEHGVVRGIVTMEDLLGELFGDIGDELKDSDAGVTTLPDGCTRLPGSMSLDDAERWLGVRWEGEAATVAGHIVSMIGRLPSPNERIEIEGVDVTILEMSPQAIRWIAVRPAQPAEEDEASA